MAGVFRYRLVAVVAVFCLELVGIALAYQFLADIDCRATRSEPACRFLRSLVARGLVLIAAFALIAAARPAPFRMLLAAAAQHPQARRWAVVHAIGLGLILLPLLLAGGEDMGARFALYLLPWGVGALAAAGGGLMCLAPPAAWRMWLADQGRAPLWVFAIAVLVPDIADTVLPLWDLEVLTAATFAAVELVLFMASDAVYSDPAAYIIGVDQFAVHVARQCSGVEGVALVLAFTGFYALLFHREVRMGRFLLVVLPLGVALSWLLNVLRIAALVLIGARVSPEIAVNGFHSYAGWMFFTLLALGLMALVHAMPWLHRSGAATAPAQPLRDDPAAAMILPFAAFMAVGTATAALFDPVDIGYPLKALVLAAVLLIFAARYLSRLPWGADPVALLAGAVVGVGWVFTAPAPGEDAAALDSVLALVPLWFLLVWIGARVIGTTLLVPLAEELFFRGYVLARIDTGNGVRRVLAIAVSTLLFALLHGRLVAAGLAGLVFALVMLRRGRVTDAILAHVAANAIVAASALASGDWSRI